MRTLEEIQKQYDKFVCAAISAEYNSDWEEPPDLGPYIQDLIEMLKEYSVEIENERNEP
jgi:hypothetical protein